MRIQHNILAMNAYRNYTNNVSALGKNLEKLSSGYKINRAGDDAAGLAISEKMRAQISGLEAAQKNVKDGISLVKTAEGAMQEIQDMLNRMVTLSTQSANGTYDNDVDRAALQQEVDALREEINRIADSANFNGIKLLDGSLDGSVDRTTMNYTSGKNNIEILQMIADDPTKEVGSKTVLHTKGADKDDKTSFEVELHNLNIVGEHGDTLDITVGDKKLSFTFDRDATSNTATAGVLKTGTVSADDLAQAIAKAWADSGYTIGDQQFTATAGTGKVTFTQAATPTNVNEVVEACKSVTVEFNKSKVSSSASWSLNATQKAQLVESGKITIGGKEYAVSSFITSTTGTGQSGMAGNYKVEYNNGKLTITNTMTSGTAPTSVGIVGKGSSVTCTAASTGGTAAVAASGTTTLSTAQVNGTTISYKIQFVSEGKTVGSEIELKTDGTASSTTIHVDGVTYTVEYNTAGAVTVTAQAEDGTKANKALTYEVVKTATTNGASTTTSYMGTIDVSGGVDFEGAKATFAISAAIAKVGTVIEFNGTKYTIDKSLSDTLKKIAADAMDTYGKYYSNVAVSGNSLVFTSKSSTDGAEAWKSVAIRYGGVVDVESLGKGTDVKSGSVASGTWNIKTTNNKQGAVSGGGNLASTTFKLNSGIVKDGNVLTIGNKEYTFKVGKNSTVKGSNIIDLSDFEEGDADLIKMAAIKLSQDTTHDVFTIGYDEENPGVVSIHEKKGQTVYTNGELSDLDTFDAMIFFNSIKDETVTETTMHGTALNLQIGDTSDSYNQMKVSIGDMHTDAMGLEDGASIADISVATSEDAQAAVDVIRGAINYVSSVRGQLGAYQNRLEHTQNNLSVMAENIQDAESTIRDTDVAEEMMSYVKNNILVQSAQAMLAQANQVPQGVLQLLG